MVSNYDPDWLVKLSEKTSPLNSSNKSTIHTYHSLQEARKKLERSHQLSNSQMVNTHSFGFWAGLFQKNQHQILTKLLSDKELISIFNQAPPQTNPLFEIHERLNVIRRARNRIAHNEPIIFKKNQSKIGFAQTESVASRISELTRWLNISPTIFDKHLELISQQSTIIKEIAI